MVDVKMFRKILDYANKNDRPDIADFIQYKLDNLIYSSREVRELIEFERNKTMYYKIVDFAREYKNPEIENFALKQLGRMRKKAKSKTTKRFIW